MSTAVSFKQYLQSKEQLRSALDRVPQCVAEYEVRRYCKLPVGESKTDKQNVSLKPKHKIIIEWLYDDPTNPTPLNLRFEGLPQLNSTAELNVMWSGERLLKWLLRNTKETV